MGRNYSAKPVEEVMRVAIATLPNERLRSVAWDQGSEMLNHFPITLVSGALFYLCDLHSNVFTG